MSLPTFKFTNFGAPTNNERVNSGLSSGSKMEKTGILSSIKNKAQDTFKEIKMPDISLDTSQSNADGNDGDSDSGSSFFSFSTLIKFILIAVIIWFMWGSLSNNNDFHLGMGDVGYKVKTFFKTMEEKGRVIVSRLTNETIAPPAAAASVSGDTNDSDSDSDSDRDSEGNSKGKGKGNA